MYEAGVFFTRRQVLSFGVAGTKALHSKLVQPVSLAWD